jgi:hypothetical protein
MLLQRAAAHAKARGNLFQSEKLRRHVSNPYLPLFGKNVL